MRYDPWEIAYLCSLGLLLCVALGCVAYIVHLAVA